MIKQTKMWLAVGLLFLACQTHAGEIYTSLFNNKAAGGYDTVAYFTEGKPVKGNKKYTVEYLGADWHFSSEKNKALFEQDPDKYRPQYDGHCAWAVAETQSKAPGNPEYWKIVDDKLYLNYNEEVQSRWVKDIPGFIKLANEYWPEVSKQ